MTDRPTSCPAIGRRATLRLLAAAGLIPVSTLLAACGDGMGDGMMDDGMMPDWMMEDGMMDPAMMADMRIIHDLLTGHERIRRSVEDIAGGIRSQTTSDDPQLVSQLRDHVHAMRERIEDNRPVRHGDPLFREIFKHHDAITMEITELPDGVEVTETSADPQVALLIRQHARAAVSEFVASGMARAMQPTALPDGYQP